MNSLKKEGYLLKNAATSPYSYVPQRYLNTHFIAPQCVVVGFYVTPFRGSDIILGVEWLRNDECVMNFHLMQSKYRIPPRAEHVCAVVDLLCRAARLCDAVALIERYGVVANRHMGVWGAVVGGCKMPEDGVILEDAVGRLCDRCEAWTPAEAFCKVY